MMTRLALNLLRAFLRCLHGFAEAILYRLDGEPAPAVADGVPAHWRKLVEGKAPQLLARRAALPAPLGVRSHPAPKWIDEQRPAPRKAERSVEAPPAARDAASSENVIPFRAAIERKMDPEFRIARPVRVVPIDAEAMRLRQATHTAMAASRAPIARTIEFTQPEVRASHRPDADMAANPQSARAAVADAAPETRVVTKQRFLSAQEISARVAWQNHPEWSHEIQPARFFPARKSAPAVSAVAVEDVVPPLAPGKSPEPVTNVMEHGAASAEQEPTPWPELPESRDEKDFPNDADEQQRLAFLRRERRGQSWNA